MVKFCNYSYSTSEHENKEDESRRKQRSIVEDLHVLPLTYNTVLHLAHFLNPPPTATFEVYLS